MISRYTTAMNVALLFLVALIFLGAFYWLAYKARPAKNQHGHSINPPQQGFKPADGEQLTIATYNVQTGKDQHGKRDISRSAAVVAPADIVGIQEVYAATWLGSKSQAQQLAEHSNFAWLFAATRRRWLREHRGNALLSRLPVKRWQIEMLPDSTGKQFRNLTTAIIDFAGQEVAILVTHLHTKKGREQQLSTVLEAFEKYEYAILLGDFNTTRQNPQLETLLSQSAALDAIQIALPDTDEATRIDWIISKGFAVESGFCEPIGISDHPYYQVMLRLNNA